jgi:hypothetical protein
MKDKMSSSSSSIKLFCPIGEGKRNKKNPINLPSKRTLIYPCP